MTACRQVESNGHRLDQDAARRYVLESLRRGDRDNRFEVEARPFVRRNVLAFAAGLQPHDARADA